MNLEFFHSMKFDLPGLSLSAIFDETVENYLENEIQM